MKKFAYFFIFLLVSCSNIKNSNEKTVFIFDFDDTISTSAVSTEVFASLVDYDPQKTADISNAMKHKHEMLKKEGKIPTTGPVSYLMISDVIKASGKQYTAKKDFSNAGLMILGKKLTPGIKDIIQNIIKNGNKVFIIGGGYGTCGVIMNMAKDIVIDQNNVFSGINSFDKNDNLIFDPSKVGFTHCATGKKIEDQFLKSTVVKYLKQNGYINGRVVHVGDGTNDLEVWQAKQADLFIGFGVNKANKDVKNGAPFFVENMTEFKKAVEQNL